MTRTGVIGLGTMGRHMARRLAEAGFAPAVHDLVQSQRALLESAGASWCDSVRDVADAADIIVLSLPDPAAVERVLTGPGGLVEAGAGRIVIDTSTTGPDVSRRCADTLLARGIDLVDAPVSGGPTGAEDGTLTVMASGQPLALQRAMPVLTVIGRRIFNLGSEAGSGQMMKIINNTICATTALATFEGLVLGSRAGLDARAMLDVLNASSGRSFSTEVKVPECILHRNFPQRFSIDLLHKDMKLCLDAAERMGASMSVSESARKMLSFAIGDGDGALDYGHIIKRYESLAGARFGCAPEPGLQEEA